MSVNQYTHFPNVGVVSGSNQAIVDSAGRLFVSTSGDYSNAIVSGTITTSTPGAGNTVALAMGSHKSASVTVSGTWTGTLVVESSTDNGNTWVRSWLSSIAAANISDILAPINSFTTTGAYSVFLVAGITDYRVRATTDTVWTGTAGVSMAATEVAGTFFSSNSIIQNVLADAKNSSTTPLTANSVFTGTSASTLGVAGIQVSLKTDQNCTVYVDQSSDGTNWDISDEYEYFYSLGGQGWTVQAQSNYYRVRVLNLSSAATTYLRLNTALCPIVEALPRSLTQKGRLKTEASLTDEYGFAVENTPMGELRTATPVRLIGTAFESGPQVDSTFWLSGATNSASAIVANSEIELYSSASANSSMKVVSNRRARYVAGISMRWRAVVRLPDAGVAGNYRRWGMASSSAGLASATAAITDGAYFQLSGTTLSVVTMKNGVEEVVPNGSFNGDLGSTFTAGTNVRTWEIYWTNSKVWFVVNDSVLHLKTAATATWAATMNHQVYLETANTTSTTESTLHCRVASIHRLGNLLTQPNSVYVAGQQTLVLKRGLGNLQQIIVSGVVQNSVITLYDNTAGSGTILWSSGAMGSQTIPFDLDFKGLPFSTGLTIVISAANSNATIVFE